MKNREPRSVVVVVERKSVALAFILTLLFGPLGMLYSTVLGALVMLVIAAVVGGITFGVGLFVVWPICILWGCVAAAGSSRRVIAE